MRQLLFNRRGSSHGGPSRGGAASDQGSVDVVNSTDIVLISLAPNLLSCA
jgi:hypothetical protein